MQKRLSGAGSRFFFLYTSVLAPSLRAGKPKEASIANQEKNGSDLQGSNKDYKYEVANGDMSKSEWISAYSGYSKIPSMKRGGNTTIMSGNEYSPGVTLKQAKANKQVTHYAYRKNNKTVTHKTDK